jgi:hypothetical protein
MTIKNETPAAWDYRGEAEQIIEQVVSLSQYTVACQPGRA